jgi:hypothetical protein
MRFNSLASAAAIAITVSGLAGFAGVAQADSSVGAATASARLDFQVVIPGVVFLQVGTGAFRQNIDAVDQIVFQPTDQQITDGGTVNATATSGNLGNGQVTVRVFGNVGELDLTSTATELVSAGNNTIPWTQIAVAVTGDVPHDLFAANGAMTVNLATQGGSPVVNRQGSWTYSYANTEDFRPGTYQGRVTYSVASP